MKARRAIVVAAAIGRISDRSDRSSSVEVAPAGCTSLEACVKVMRQKCNQSRARKSNRRLSRRCSSSYTPAERIRGRACTCVPPSLNGMRALKCALVERVCVGRGVTRWLTACLDRTLNWATIQVTVRVFVSSISIYSAVQGFPQQLSPN